MIINYEKMGKKVKQAMENVIEDLMEDSELTEKNKIFCREYILDWNATRSYLAAYPNVKDSNVAAAAASRMLTNVKIQDYIKIIQDDLEKTAGVSRLRVISEHMKLAFSSIAHLHNTWIKRKDFEELTEDQKACIAEIDTKIKTEWEYDADEKQKTPINVEYVRVKLYDKQKALDSISKMLGYDAASKIDLTSKGASISSIKLIRGNEGTDDKT